MFDRNYAIYKLAEELALQKRDEGKISECDVDTFVRIVSYMFPYNYDYVMEETNRTIASLGATDIKSTGQIKIEDLMDKSKIHSGQLANVDGTIPQDVPSHLPSADEYRKRSDEYSINYLDTFYRKYSEPAYMCPKCQTGGMCRNETKVLASIPPKYEYVCNKCGYVDYNTI